MLVRSSTRHEVFYFVFAMLVFAQISRSDHRMENAKIKLIINGSAGARSVMNHRKRGQFGRRDVGKNVLV